MRCLGTSTEHDVVEIAGFVAAVANVFVTRSCRELQGWGKGAKTVSVMAAMA